MGPRAALAALAVLALTPAAAHASVTIGSSLQTPSTYDNLSGYCSSSPLTCTGTNLNLPPAETAPGGLTAPFTGVIVKWRVNSGSSGNPVALRVLHPGGGTTFTGAGTSETHMTASGVSDFFPSRLRITQGDSIGLDIGNSALIWSTVGGTSADVWGSVNGFQNGLADGTTAAGQAQPRELLVQAVIEPDVDGDGYGDETQDACPHDPQRQAPPCGTPGGGNNNGGGGTNNTPDTTPPMLTALAVAPNSLPLGRRGHIAFRLSEPSRVTLTFTRLVPGRRRNGRCVAGARRRAGRHCTALVRVAALTVRAQGRTTLAFTGIVAGRRLALGRYRLSARAVDLVGNVGRPRTATFTLRRAPARRHR